MTAATAQFRHLGQPVPCPFCGKAGDVQDLGRSLDIGACHVSEDGDLVWWHPPTRCCPSSTYGRRKR
jgi:hypothetical protein